MLIDIDKEVKEYEKRLTKLSYKLEAYCSLDDNIKTIVANALDFSNKPHQTTLGAMIRLAMRALGWHIDDTNTLDKNLDELHSFIANCFYDDTCWYLDFRSGEFVGHTCDTNIPIQEPKEFLEVCYYALSKYNKFFEKYPNITKKDCTEFYETNKSKKVNMTVVTKGQFKFQFKDEDDIEIFKHTVLKEKLKYAVNSQEIVTIEVEND